MAVDFATKQRERAGAGWALRNVKLRMSRKLIFVSGLLICFSCHTRDLKILYEIPERPAGVLIEYVSSYANQTPLEILAAALMRYEVSKETVGDLLDSYDSFLECLSNVNHREHLKNLSYDNSKNDKVFQQMREIGHLFQRGLDRFFFDESDQLRNLILKYGIF